MTNRNPILNELRQTREKLLEDAGGTLSGLVAQLQQDELKSKHNVIALTDLPKNRRQGKSDSDHIEDPSTMAH